MIRVVLDTNIVVSALLQPLGPPAHVLMLALSGSIQLCVSGSIYAEYEEVISRPRFERSEDIIAGTEESVLSGNAGQGPQDNLGQWNTASTAIPASTATWNLQVNTPAYASSNRTWSRVGSPLRLGC